MIFSLSLTPSCTLRRRNVNGGTSRTTFRCGRQSTILPCMALKLAMIDAALSDIRTTGADSSISKSEALTRIQQLLRNLKIQHRSWEVFKRGFEEINPHFFEKLYRVCPNLSNAEIRMSSFMLLNLPMSAVADISNRSVRTIGTIRYNVRRKLCITGNAEAWMTRLSMADDKEIERLATIVKRASDSNG